MNSKDFVSYGVAELLKERDFDWDCYFAYDIGDRKHIRQIDGTKPYLVSSNQFMPDRIAAPTLYEAQKWLRETKSIHIQIEVIDKNTFHADAYDYSEVEDYEKDGKPNFLYGTIGSSYEDALNSGIKMILELYCHGKNY